MRPEPWTDDADDEIDLAELGASLVAQGRMILAAGAVGLGLAGGYATVIARPTYEATAVFAFDGAGAKGALGNLGGLAALAGLSAGATSEDKLVFDRVTSADFILRLADTVGLREDRDFNPALGMSRRERLLAIVGLSLGPKTYSPAEIDAAIVERFRKSVTLTATKNAAITAKVSHHDAGRAAVIANAVVADLLKDTLADQMARSRSEVTYLGQQLGEVQAEMDAAVGRLQDFSISRNALSVEDLLRRSSQLVQLRETRDSVAEMRAGVAAMIAAGAAPEARREVEAQYPVLLSTEFRLQAGLGAAETDLDGMEPARLESILGVIDADLGKLDGSIRSAEANAKISAEEAAELLRLQRDVKVHEATYEAVVEQYKSRSISGGFQEAKGTMLQQAVPPVTPAAPKVPLVVALGTVLGLVAGAGVAVLRGMRSGVLHTPGAVLGAFGAMPHLAVRTKGRHARRDAVDVASLLAKDGERHVVLWNLGSVRAAGHVVEAAALALAEAGVRVALVSLEGGVRPVSGVTLCEVKDVASKALRGSLADEIRALGSAAERVVIVGGAAAGGALALPALAPLGARVVAFAEPKVTTRADIARLLAVAKPDALIMGA